MTTDMIHVVCCLRDCLGRLVRKRLLSMARSPSGTLPTDCLVRFWHCLGQIPATVLWHADGVQHCNLVNAMTEKLTPFIACCGPYSEWMSYWLVHFWRPVGGVPGIVLWQSDEWRPASCSGDTDMVDFLSSIITCGWSTWHRAVAAW